jgi:lipoprotein signal peptidase
MQFLKDRPFYWIFATLALTGLIVDQVSKYVVFAKIHPEDRAVIAQVDVVSGFALRTTYPVDKDGKRQSAGDHPLASLRTISSPHLPHLNRGALWGFGNEKDETENQGVWDKIVGYLRYALSVFEDSDGTLNTFFAFVSAIAAVGITIWAARPSVKDDRWINIALGLILAGTLGNCYDRIVFGGVRDFLHADFGFWPCNPWPDFNIADACLVTGAGILMVHSFLVKEKEETPAKENPAAAQTQSPAPVPAASGTTS